MLKLQECEVDAEDRPAYPNKIMRTQVHNPGHKFWKNNYGKILLILLPFINQLSYSKKEPVVSKYKLCL